MSKLGTFTAVALAITTAFLFIAVGVCFARLEAFDIIKGCLCLVFGFLLLALFKNTNF